ncbi:MAG: antibiotic biosynthesis monooxygenase [Actinomycetota bacterium]|nr:antibiotic biosynthesis monooxygenase [Actinomycetota bacterium]
MYARVTNIRFPPNMKAEVTRVAEGLAPVLNEQRGFKGLQMLTDPNAGQGIIVSFWETEADGEASESSASYIGQMSMLSSFLAGPLASKTYEASVRA